MPDDGHLCKCRSSRLIQYFEAIILQPLTSAHRSSSGRSCHRSILLYPTEDLFIQGQHSIRAYLPEAVVLSAYEDFQPAFGTRSSPLLYPLPTLFLSPNQTGLGSNDSPSLFEIGLESLRQMFPGHGETPTSRHIHIMTLIPSSIPTSVAVRERDRIWQIVHWFNSGSNTKTEAKVNRFAREAHGASGFPDPGLDGFDARRGT